MYPTFVQGGQFDQSESCRLILEIQVEIFLMVFVEKNPVEAVDSVKSACGMVKLLDEASLGSAINGDLENMVISEVNRFSNLESILHNLSTGGEEGEDALDVDNCVLDLCIAVDQREGDNVDLTPAMGLQRHADCHGIVDARI